MKAVRSTWTALGLVAGICCFASAAAAATASAEIKDGTGRTVARASFHDTKKGISVHVEAKGLAAGTYGTHVHAVGRCEAPAFASAGGHWNPAGRQHGTENPQGHHMGDLPNLVVNAKGRGSVSFLIAGGAVAGGASPLLDADGAAIVVHAQADDYRTDPAGNAGARMACGVVAHGT